MLKRLLLVLFLASPALAADDLCVWGLSGESGSTTEYSRICTVTTQFDNVATTTVVEASLGFGNTQRVRLLRVEVRSTNCALCIVVIQTATGANAGTILWSAAAAYLVAFTPEAGGAAYTDYINELVDTDFTPTLVSGERRAYVRLYNGDPSSDDDITIFTVWGS